MTITTTKKKINKKIKKHGKSRREQQTINSTPIKEVSQTNTQKKTRKKKYPRNECIQQVQSYHPVRYCDRCARHCTNRRREKLVLAGRSAGEQWWRKSDACRAPAAS